MAADQSYVTAFHDVFHSSKGYASVKIMKVGNLRE